MVISKKPFLKNFTKNAKFLFHIKKRQTMADLEEILKENSRLEKISALKKKKKELDECRNELLEDDADLDDDDKKELDDINRQLAELEPKEKEVKTPALVSRQKRTASIDWFIKNVNMKMGTDYKNEKFHHVEQAWDRGRKIGKPVRLAKNNPRYRMIKEAAVYEQLEVMTRYMKKKFGVNIVTLVGNTSDCDEVKHPKTSHDDVGELRYRIVRPYEPENANDVAATHERNKAIRESGYYHNLNEKTQRAVQTVVEDCFMKSMFFYENKDIYDD